MKSRKFVSRIPIYLYGPSRGMLRILSSGDKPICCALPNNNKPICCALPDNNKVNPLINFFKMPFNLNFIKKTETQISRQKSSINLYAVLYQIVKRKPFNKLLQNAD